jgi:hypothetical protein
VGKLEQQKSDFITTFALVFGKHAATFINKKTAYACIYKKKSVPLLVN